MSIFYLKEGDTRPVLEVALKNPDGSAYDLTAASEVRLHVEMFPNRIIFSRAMEVVAPATGGIVRYTWVAADWTDPTTPLVVGPDIPMQPGDWEHRMEYQVTAGTLIHTFPSDGFDTLRITRALA